MASKGDKNKKRTASRQGPSKQKTSGKKTSGKKTHGQEQQLYERVASIVEQARNQVARTVNTAMVQAYWHIGREIVEVEQQGLGRAGYGEQLMARLAERLSKRFGKGFGVATLRRIRQFYLSFPQGGVIQQESGDSRIRSAVLIESAPRKGGHFSPHLGWTHYLILMKVTNPDARAFYEIEAASEGWSTRELERQIGSLLFERLAKSRDRDRVLALAREGQSISMPRDVIKDPLVLEFLHLEERAHWRERDLESAIIDRLQTFLLELGKGFSFVARQKRITLEGDHFYIDLVLYNRLLQGFVLVDLKLGKLTHQDLGQMQMYVNYFDRFLREPHEAATVGIVLCADKNETMVRITLPETNEQIHAPRYQLYLPTEKQLTEALIRERRAAELALGRGVKRGPEREKKGEPTG